MSHNLPENISTYKKVTQVETKDDEKLVKKFMKERDIPNWFRGLSKFQLDAANSLLNCIRDDSEQATSHRVRDALRRIGIEPLVCGAKIKFAMQLSRGNDIAFLWFLMELYYRSFAVLCNSTKYSVNEQIFMTTIAHLDTIPTLRELDKILPKKPQSPAKKKIHETKRMKKLDVLPYFKRHCRPVPYGKSLTLNEVDNVACFVEYEKYLDHNYIVPNEFNRWFAFYQLKKSERIAKGIINDQIDDIFKPENLFLVQKDEKSSFCSHHQTLKALKESLANELIVAKQKACEKYFDVNGHLRDRSYKRVIDQLNKEIDRAKDEFKKLTKTGLKSFCCVEVDEKANGSKGDQQTCCKDYQTCNEEDNLYDYGHAAVLSDKCNYFKASTCHKPYKFNYEKIFDLGPKDPIKQAVASALNADSSCNMSVEHNRAIQKYCKSLWEQEVKNYNISYEEDQRKRKKKAPNNKEHEVQFDQSYFDPRNTKQMESLLLKALTEIKKNKKFVLASLPDSHKFPILREWLKKRYGMVYTRQEKRETLKLSKKVFQVLRKNAFRIRIPNLNELATKQMVSYDCKNYLLKKTNYLKDKYYHNFKASLLEDTRIYWIAVRPYQCPKGPPRREFFAYMPARENDVHVFRPWKAHEHAPAKKEWDKRQRMRRMELLC